MMSKEVARSREREGEWQRGEPVNRRRKWRNTNCIKRGSEAVVAEGMGAGGFNAEWGTEIKA